ncbi:MAG: hypothetical protein BWY91_03321 [bacterium ADurb.BinA028]|nr:MAG: hypothetical protein BWY91_03321 [bacterium ADurb.BinA028]
MVGRAATLDGENWPEEQNLQSRVVVAPAAAAELIDSVSCRQVIPSADVQLSRTRVSVRAGSPGRSPAAALTGSGADTWKPVWVEVVTRCANCPAGIAVAAWARAVRARDSRAEADGIPEVTTLAPAKPTASNTLAATRRRAGKSRRRVRGVTVAAAGASEVAAWTRASTSARRAGDQSWARVSSSGRMVARRVRESVVVMSVLLGERGRRGE